jgi:hypothetical protein
MIYDIYLLQLGFHPVAVVGRLAKKPGNREHKMRNNIQNNTKADYTK